MQLDDCYRLLEIDPSASDDEVRRAHRDLIKVWHPDRFGRDQALRARAEEKLKAINAAYETICASRDAGWRPPRREAPQPAPPPDPAELERLRVARARNWAIGCSFAALFILLRRPTPGGLVIAVVLFGAAGLFLLKMRRR